MVASVIFVDGVVLNIGFVKTPADGRFNRELSPGAVSYTHLDVYKRQPVNLKFSITR